MVQEGEAVLYYELSSIIEPRIHEECVVMLVGECY